MKDLIEALQIFEKYLDAKYPTYCANGELMIVGIPQYMVTSEDRVRLEQLSFQWSDTDKCYKSQRFGSS